MPEQTYDYGSSYQGDVNTKLRDLEERQRLSKDRILLIGENLVNFREETGKEITEIKIALEGLKQDILKIRDSLQRTIEELDNRARASELELLKKQARMFQPLASLTKKEIEEIINNKLKKE